MSYTDQLCASILLCSLLVSNASAHEWGIEIESAFISEYADRGTTVAGQQIQSSLTLSNGAFSTGITYANTLGDDRLVYADEIDINIDYTTKVNGSTTLNIGTDLIHVPNAGSLFDIGATNASTIEIYGGVSFEQALSPSLTVIYDVHLEDFTLEATASQSLEFSARSELAFELIGGYAAISGADDNLYITAGTKYTYAIADNLSIYAGLYGGLSSDRTFTDAQFSNGLAPVLTNNTSSAWLQIGITSGF